MTPSETISVLEQAQERLESARDQLEDIPSPWDEESPLSSDKLIDTAYENIQLTINQLRNAAKLITKSN